MYDIDEISLLYQNFNLLFLQEITPKKLIVCPHSTYAIKNGRWSCKYQIISKTSFSHSFIHSFKVTI